MGREIRRVPKNWEHPKSNGKFIPLYDLSYEQKARDWLENCIKWENNTHDDLIKHPEYKKEYPFFWQYECNPPDPSYYRSEFTKEANCYQMYETVSEGTPVSPVFETKNDLVDYLVKNGDFWDQIRGDGGWIREIAEQFVEREWAMSGMFVNGEIKTPRDGS
jgi:hypothetical protein